jgi:hypothetical protein
MSAEETLVQRAYTSISISEEAIMPLANWALAFSGSMCRDRLGPDILSRRSEYLSELLQTLQELGKEGSFWL